MNTITTKQLRERMPQVVRDIQMGHEIRLSYRQRVIATIRPAEPFAISLKRGSSKAIQSFLESTSFGDIPKELQESTSTFKQQISQLRDGKLAN